jgi:hypothetical protein
MAYRRYLQVIFLSILFFLMLSLTTCEKFSGDQTVPAYLSIDSICLTTTSTQGSESQNITDAWVYVGSNFIGAFELPAKFPVLKQGKQSIQVFAGIKKNGIATTRAAYPFYSSIDKTLELSPDSTTRVPLTCVKYETNTKFLWMENFEGASISLDTTPRSAAAIVKTPLGSGLAFEGDHSGLVVLDTSKSSLEMASHSGYTIPRQPVFLEMNFDLENPLVVGVIIYVNYSIVQFPVMTLNNTGGKWKKIYIDLTDALNAYSGASGFKVYYSATLDGLTPRKILLDNIKLVTRE